MTARPDPSRPLPGESPEPGRTDAPVSGGSLLERQRRILFGLAIAIMALGIVAIAQSFHSSVLANNRVPEQRRIVAAEPARTPPPADGAPRREPAVDSLLFQAAGVTASPLPSAGFKREAKPAAPQPRAGVVSRSASCADPMPKQAWLDICG